jgi:hypothetical protein
MDEEFLNDIKVRRTEVMSETVNWVHLLKMGFISMPLRTQRQALRFRRSEFLYRSNNYHLFTKEIVFMAYSV